MTPTVLSNVTLFELQKSISDCMYVWNFLGSSPDFSIDEKIVIKISSDEIKKHREYLKYSILRFDKYTETLTRVNSNNNSSFTNNMQ